MTNKKCFRGHEYPAEKAISLGCPICFAEWLDKGGTLD
jgi:hypothetical protein